MNKLKETKEERHLALYRKYRPQEFKDVLGQENALKTLENSIKQNKISHAYIFSGDRGTGKTTVARIFAKEIGSSRDDIFELDAASNNGVEDMRILIENTQASTFGSKYKIYILDEAHMLSKSSFNALLKTLEEPPANVIFILATTDRHKIPATIISRCQEINFISPSIKILEENILRISKKESRKIDNDSVNLIAKQGKGSFRDSLGILEKVFNTVDIDEINFKDTQRVLGLTSNEDTFEILESISKSDKKSLIEKIEKFNLNTNDSIISFYIQLVKMFEYALLIRFLKDEEAKKIFDGKLGEDLIVKLRDVSSANVKIISSTNLYKLLQMEKEINSAGTQIKKSLLIIGLLVILES
ncbi:MAG: DNA polymerase III subunit gamma/tau [Candidatus Pacebacteria bacterium]|nr:DNA polymerase III subunit gamma/tau [Candidatus Paceibacterota bacterium]